MKFYFILRAVVILFLNEETSFMQSFLKMPVVLLKKKPILLLINLKPAHYEI